MLPASIAATLALWRLGQSFGAPTHRRLEIVLKVSAVTLTGYGAASSVIEFSTPEIVNNLADSFHPEHMVAPLLSVGVLRTFFAVAITLLLSDAFLIEGRKARLEKSKLE